MIRRSWWLSIGATALLLPACGGGDSGTPAPPPNVIDIAVDANRDGIVDPTNPAEQEFEAEWNATVGASFLANLDDDDMDGVRDCEDEIVNGDQDALDLARIQVTPWPRAKDKAEGLLHIDRPGDAENIRIFKLGPTGWQLIMGSIGPCNRADNCSYVTDYRLTTDEVRAGVTLGIEARRFKGMPLPTIDIARKNEWDGMVQLAFAVEEPGKGFFVSDDVPDGIDRVTLRVAPWLMFGSLGLHDKLHSSSAVSVFVTGNGIAAEAAGVSYDAYATTFNEPGGWGDIWTEDFFQTGWTGMPGPNGTVQGMRIYNARPWGRAPQGASAEVRLEYLPIRWILGNPEKGRPPAVLGPDMGGAAFYDPEHEGKGHTQDSHGAHDLVPPYEGQSMGRIITSTKTYLETREFYDAQEVQGPAIIIDTSWLAVEHVDEFFHWVPAATPRGWKLLVASPQLMTKMLQDLDAQGHGSRVIHQGKGGAFETTVSGALANAQLNSWSQTADVKIQGHIDTMKAETGLTDAEIVEIPTWFEELAGGSEKVAWNPGMVNMRMMGNVADITKPFGPLINGSDPFEEDIKKRLGSPENQLGSDGQGLKVYFTDGWYYHAALGEVHCGTNASAPSPFVAGFWWESGK